ncbi:MAG: OmpA family protein [Rhodocyclaceae bacterium]|nr:OmpA family protein [Rhodocyclaceae bacterium]
MTRVRRTAGVCFAISTLALAGCTHQVAEPMPTDGKRPHLGVTQQDRAGQLHFEWCAPCAQPTRKTRALPDLPARGRVNLPAAEQPSATVATQAAVPPAAVFFEPGKAFISPADAAILDQWVARLPVGSALRIQVTGRTDTSGRRVSNIDLARRRASTVAEYLRLRGVDGRRMSVESADPPDAELALLPGVVARSTGTAMDRNRRVDLAAGVAPR